MSGRRLTALIVALVCLVSLTLGTFAPGVRAFQPDGPATGSLPEPCILPIDRSPRSKLEAARDYIKEGSWAEAIRLIQALLDTQEDTFRPTPADAPGKNTWTSTRGEAERLLASLPQAGREFYHVTYDAAARKMVQDAIARRDLAMLDTVVRRYLYTSAGPDALVYLGTFHLDRGRPELAAPYFLRLLELVAPGKDPKTEKVAAPVLFRAALAFRGAGSRPREDMAWRRLAVAFPAEGLRLGPRMLTLEQARAELDRWPHAPSELHDWRLFRGDPGRSARNFGDVPLLSPRYRVATARTLETQEAIDQALRSSNPSSPVLPAAVPIAAGGKLVYRHYAGIAALDVHTGREAWRADSALSPEAVLHDPGRKVQMFEKWISMYGASRHLLFENSVIGTLSTDGHRVYAVDDLAFPAPVGLVNKAQTGFPWSFSTLHDAVHHNRLKAYDLETGALAWEVGGAPPRPERQPAAPRAPKPRRSPLDETFFLGPPLPLGGHLYVVAEKLQDLTLFCLRADNGEIAWSQTLATARDKILVDVARRLHAAHPAHADGLLICPTNTGAVVAVDLLSRNLVWAHTYRDRTPASPDMTGMPFVPETLLPTWKACAPLVSDGKVVFTAPDSDAVHCLNARTGVGLWRVPRTEDDLYVGAIHDGKVLMVGRNACRAFSLGSGELLWQHQTETPTGQGVLAGKVYYLPLKDGALLALNLDNPLESATVKARPSSGKHGPASLGNLVFHEGNLWSQDFSAVTAYPQLAEYLREIDQRLAQNPKDPVALTERGGLRLDRGDVVGAVADLHDALANGPPAELLEATRPQLYTALTRLLQRDFGAGEKYLDEYRELARVLTAVPAGASPERQQQLEADRRRRQIQCFALIARGREKQGRVEDALQAYRDLLAAANGGALMTVPDDPAVEVRPDVWVQAQIAALVGRITPEQAGRLAARLEREWRDLQAGNTTLPEGTLGSVEATPLGRFASLFSGLPGPVGAPGREARLLLSRQLAEHGGRRQALDADLYLLGVQRSASTPAVAAQALLARARLFTRYGLLEDAVAAHRQLARDYPKVPADGDRAGPALLDDLALDKRFLAHLDEMSPPWVPGKLKAVEVAGNFPNRDLLPFEPPGPDTASNLPGRFPGMPALVGEPPPFFQNLRLTYDPDAQLLQVWNRQTNTERWSVPVPGVGNPRNYLFGTLSYQAVGHLLVLNLGPMVAAVDTIERRVRWTRNLLDDSSAGFQFVTGQPGGGTLILSRNGQIAYRVGQFGPVTAHGVCVQTRAGLATLDLLTGETRWQRSDLPMNFDVFGDDQHLYVVEYHQADGTVRGLRALRAADGVGVSVPDGVESFAHKIRVLGRSLLISQEGAREEVQLRLYDVHSGKDLWTRAFPPKSIVLDSRSPELVVVASPDGTITLTDLKTRREVQRLKVDALHLDKVTSGTLLQDRTQYYVALLGPNSPNNNIVDGPNPNFMGGLNAVPVNGMLYAFDRATGEMRWNTNLLCQTILIERFEDLPVILCSAASVRKTNNPNLGDVGVTATRSIDKHTGKLRYNREMVNMGTPFHTLHVDYRTGAIDLIGANVKVRHVPVRDK
jgi:outer membrane protein assembly factor BamB/tetratricopeptide (TPR) repeat protein